MKKFTKGLIAFLAAVTIVSTFSNFKAFAVDEVDVPKVRSIKYDATITINRVDEVDVPKVR
jgi:hypothetical protein